MTHHGPVTLCDFTDHGLDDSKESHRNGRFFLTAELEASMNRKRRPGYGHLLLFTAALLSVVLIFVFGIAGAAFLIQQGLEAAR